MPVGATEVTDVPYRKDFGDGYYATYWTDNGNFANWRVIYNKDGQIVGVQQMDDRGRGNEWYWIRRYAVVGTHTETTDTGTVTREYQDTNGDNIADFLVVTTTTTDSDVSETARYTERDDGTWELWQIDLTDDIGDTMRYTRGLDGEIRLTSGTELRDGRTFEYEDTDHNGIADRVKITAHAGLSDAAHPDQNVQATYAIADDGKMTIISGTVLSGDRELTYYDKDGNGKPDNLTVVEKRPGDVEVISYHTIADDGTTNAIQIVTLYPDNTHTVAYDSNGDGNLDRYEAKTADGTMLYAIGADNKLTPISGTEIRDGQTYTWKDYDGNGLADTLTVEGPRLDDGTDGTYTEYRRVNGEWRVRLHIETVDGVSIARIDTTGNGYIDTIQQNNTVYQINHATGKYEFAYVMAGHTDTNAAGETREYIDITGDGRADRVKVGDMTYALTAGGSLEPVSGTITQGDRKLTYEDVDGNGVADFLTIDTMRYSIQSVDAEKDIRDFVSSQGVDTSGMSDADLEQTLNAMFEGSLPFARAYLEKHGRNTEGLPDDAIRANAKSLRAQLLASGQRTPIPVSGTITTNGITYTYGDTDNNGVADTLKVEKADGTTTTITDYTLDSDGNAMPTLHITRDGEAETITEYKPGDDGNPVAIKITTRDADGTVSVATDSTGDGNLDRLTRADMIYALDPNLTVLPVSGTTVKDGQTYVYRDADKDGQADFLTVSGTDADGNATITDYRLDSNGNAIAQRVHQTDKDGNVTLAQDTNGDGELDLLKSSNQEYHLVDGVYRPVQSTTGKPVPWPATVTLDDDTIYYGSDWTAPIGSHGTASMVWNPAGGLWVTGQGQVIGRHLRTERVVDSNSYFTDKSLDLIDVDGDGEPDLWASRYGIWDNREDAILAANQQWSRAEERDDREHDAAMRARIPAPAPVVATITAAGIEGFGGLPTGGRAQRDLVLLSKTLDSDPTVIDLTTIANADGTLQTTILHRDGSVTRGLVTSDGTHHITDGRTGGRDFSGTDDVLEGIGRGQPVSLQVDLGPTFQSEVAAIDALPPDQRPDAYRLLNSRYDGTYLQGQGQYLAGLAEIAQLPAESQPEAYRYYAESADILADKSKANIANLQAQIAAEQEVLTQTGITSPKLANLQAQLQTAEQAYWQSTNAVQQAATKGDMAAIGQLPLIDQPQAYLQVATMATAQGNLPVAHAAKTSAANAAATLDKAVTTGKQYLQSIGYNAGHLSDAEVLAAVDSVRSEFARDGFTGPGSDLAGQTVQHLKSGPQLSAEWDARRRYHAALQVGDGAIGASGILGTPALSPMQMRSYAESRLPQRQHIDTSGDDMASLNYLENINDFGDKLGVERRPGESMESYSGRVTSIVGTRNRQLTDYNAGIRALFSDDDLTGLDAIAGLNQLKEQYAQHPDIVVHADTMIKEIRGNIAAAERRYEFAGQQAAARAANPYAGTDPISDAGAGGVTLVTGAEMDAWRSDLSDAEQAVRDAEKGVLQASTAEGRRTNPDGLANAQTTLASAKAQLESVRASKPQPPKIQLPDYGENKANPAVISQRQQADAAVQRAGQAILDWKVEQQESGTNLTGNPYASGYHRYGEYADVPQHLTDALTLAINNRDKTYQNTGWRGADGRDYASSQSALHGQSPREYLLGIDLPWAAEAGLGIFCLLYTSPSPRD